MSRKPQQRVIVAMIAGCMAMLGLLPALLAQDRPVLRDDAAAMQVVGRLNTWRMDEGLWPLRRNETLDAMALYQAEYLLTLSRIPNGAEIHRGRNGEGVKQRALFPQFRWPFYGRAENIAIGEIAAVYGTMDGAFAFWLSSTPHRNSVLTAHYREVGVAALPRRTGIGTIYVVVFGAQPDVLPALADPRGNQILLSNEVYSAQRLGGGIQTATQIRIFDAQGRALTEWTPWQPQVDVPAKAGDLVYVLYSDGKRESIAVVPLQQNRALLRGYVPTLTPSPTPTLTPSATFTPTPLVTLTPSPTWTPSPTLTPSPTPTPPGPELVLIYDNASLSLVNVALYPVSLLGLEIVGQNYTLNMRWWTETQRGIDLNRFPPGQCLRAYSYAQQPSSALPKGCTAVRSDRSRLQPGERFWLLADFEVRRQGQVLAQCQLNAGQCTVDLPELP